MCFNLNSLHSLVTNCIFFEKEKKSYIFERGRRSPGRAATKGSLSLLEAREEDNGRNTRGEIIRLLEVSPGDSGGHSISIDRVGVADGPANRGHSRIRWVCHGGRSQFVVTGNQHVFFELLILRPYLPSRLFRVSYSSGLSLTGQTESHWLTVCWAKNCREENFSWECAFCRSQTEN